MSISFVSLLELKQIVDSVLVNIVFDIRFQFVLDATCAILPAR